MGGSEGAEGRGGREAGEGGNRAKRQARGGAAPAGHGRVGRGRVGQGRGGLTCTHRSKEARRAKEVARKDRTRRSAEQSARRGASPTGRAKLGAGPAGRSSGQGRRGARGIAAERGGPAGPGRGAFPRVFHVKHSHTRARTRLERQLEAETPDRLDVGVGARGAQLVAEVGHVHVDRAVLGGIGLAPHQLEQLLLGEHALRM